jgi:hypothetical protein
MSTNPAVAIPKVLLPQSNITAAFVHSHSNLLSDVSPVLPTYSNHTVTRFTVYSVWLLPVEVFILLPPLYKI